MPLRHALLGLLVDGPRSGYELKRLFDGVLANAWSVSWGQLYPTLRRLAELGWVTRRAETGHRAPEKNVYTITERGRRKLDKWLCGPFPSSWRLKDELAMRFPFLHRLPGSGVALALQSLRDLTEARRREWQRTLESLAGDAFLAAVVQRGIMHLETEERWLEEVASGLGKEPATSSSGRGPAAPSV